MAGNIHLSDIVESRLSLKHFNNTYAKDNSSELEYMKKTLKRLIDNELTERQKEIALMHYYQSKSISEIAGKLKINKSTVSRSLKSTANRLRKYLQYCVINNDGY